MLLANHRTYPPKYVLALAVKHAIGREMPSEDFSGGEQTNSILRTLGYEVEAINPQPNLRKAPPKSSPAVRKPSAARSNGDQHAVVTVVLEKDGYDYTFDARFDGMASILAALADEVRGEAVVLFPGGWFKAGLKPPTKLLQQVEKDVTSLVQVSRQYSALQA